MYFIRKLKNLIFPLRFDCFLEEDIAIELN